MYTFLNKKDTFIHSPFFQENFLNLNEIKKIKDGLNLIPYLDGSTSYQLEENKKKDKYSKLENYRLSKVKWINQEREWDWLFLKLKEYITNINNIHYNFNLSSIYENIQYTEYSSKYKGHYNWHMDIGGVYPFNLRKISLSIQLSSSDEYEGGDLEIFNGVSLEMPFIAPKTRGTICVFPSFLLHRVTPVTNGTRRSLVLWVGGSHLQ